MPDPTPLDPLDADLLRTQGDRILDFIARYWASLEARPVAPHTLSPSDPARVNPGDVLSALPLAAPEHPGDAREWDRILSDLDSIILPALTNWQHPGFFAYFPANISAPAVLGELLAAGLGVNGMLWATSPAVTELETRVLDWLARAIDLPDSFLSTSGNGGSVIQGTASEATLSSLVAARHRARQKLSRGAGVPPVNPHYTLYTSTQAHSSIIKAAMIAGLADSPEDRTHLRLIETDRSHAMRPDALARAIVEDLAAGRVPIHVAATLGTTSSTAFDPLPAIHEAIASACRNASPAAFLPWLHVDAAHAGSAFICPEFRALAQGLEHADSFCTNPHKWLLTNFDCDCFYTSDRRSLIASMSISPEYLRNSASSSGAVIDYRDWHIPLGRRFRALKLWFVLRAYGLEALRDGIREHVRLAAWFEERVRSDPRFELAAPRTINLVCFRLRPPPGSSDEHADRLNRTLLDRLNATGRLHLIHTILPDEHGTGRVTLRFSVGTSTTRERHVHQAWETISRESDVVLGSAAS
jgi:aromatic-L-amino-acid decarboxylase